MDFKHVETFVTIARLKSFSKAADFLFLTQPTISNHIQNLENALGTTLINRYSKNITLTQAGETFLAYAIEILNKKEEAMSSLKSLGDNISGTLELVCSSIPEQYILPSLISSFSRNYPQVIFRVMHYDSQRVVTDILSGLIDFGFVGNKVSNPSLEYIQIAEDDLVIIAPNISKYKNISTMSLHDLLSERIIIREKGSGTRNFFENMLKKKNIKIEDLNVIAHMQNIQAIKECVKYNLGISIVSSRSIQTEIKYGEIKRICLEDSEATRKFYFVYHKSKFLSPTAQKFKDFILKNSVN
ncbi:selenium metabolism-associated LysR family transcriptional regulator [Anaeromicrobium sediminis]|uniref:HTH lysR-type domain-containing protein n=1 Tax=Anaeromicrobium sediminis TaxID=1478221 RepID=A0A267MK95_9FIRM|nr:selenium metabolism-associated LysR family transcriptional regulator [Anaeromicrobium sediminis]PAB59213.1 hypothetical protein CCE28_11890 [Anaeromicrobium sediminis]